MKAADALSSRRAVAIGRLAMVTGGSPVEWGRPAGPASAGTGRRQVVDRPLRSGCLGGDPLAGPDERATERAAQTACVGMECLESVRVDLLQELYLGVHRVHLAVVGGAWTVRLGGRPRPAPGARVVIRRPPGPRSRRPRRGSGRC